MTREETVILTSYVIACCPQQALNEYTPDAWHDILGHLDLGEATAAAAAVARRKPFVAPAEILAEIARARGADKPHSQACRSGDCRDCHVSWCNCACHPTAVRDLTAPERKALTP